MPDSFSENRRIMKFSSVDGSPIDLNFITNASTGDNFILPVEAKIVRDEVWISDQNADAIYRFSQGGGFLGSFIDDNAGPNVTAVHDLTNIRGFEVIGNRLFVTSRDLRVSGVLGPGSPAEGADRPSIRIFDATTGSDLGTVRPPNVGSPWGALAYNGQLLIADEANINITASQDRGFIFRHDVEGNFIDNFASGNGSMTGGTTTTGGVTTPNNGLRRPLQMLELSNGNLMVANGGDPRRLYEFDPDGNIVRTFTTAAPTSDTNPALRQFVPMGLAELANGNIFVTGTDSAGQFSNHNGVFSLNLGTGLFTPILKGQDLGGVRITPMFANVVPEPSSMALLAVAAGGLLRRRRAGQAPRTLKVAAVIKAASQIR